jgi:hypothetical protein
MAFGGIITLFVGLTIGVVLVGDVVLRTIYDTNTSGFSSPVITFFQTLLPIVIVAGLILIVLQ